MTQPQNFHVDGHGPISISIREGIIAGWTARDAEAVAHHIAELEEIGVPPPSTVPLYYRVSASLFSCEEQIETVGNTSSGEAEPVLIDDGERLYLGLGSDHTDRQLETHSVALSKQICAKPVAPRLWPMDAVAAHLDDIVIRSFVRDDEQDEWTAYQEGSLASIRPLAELIAGSPAAAGTMRLKAGTAMMCGTFAVLAGGVRPARFFLMQMIDDRLGRRIEHAYETRPLPLIG